MGSMSFDFNKIKRTFMTVKLKDGRKLIVKQPMKKTFEKITAVQDVDESKIGIDEAMDIFGGLCAEILSNNMKDEKVSVDYMTGNYDIEEMKVFVEQFMEFVSGLGNDPN